MVGGILLTPILTGFVDLTFSKRSFDTLGIANEAPQEGAYLKDDTVYKLPLDEKFRVKGDVFLTVTERLNYKDQIELFATFTEQDGDSSDRQITPTASLSLRLDCGELAAHLMRPPREGEEERLILYNYVPSQKVECQTLLRRMVRSAS